MTKQLLEKDQSELDKIGLKAYKFAVNRLTATDAIRYMISLLRNHRLSKEDGKEVEIRANPWINAPKL